MGHTPSNTWRALGLGAALAVLSMLACLACAASRDGHTISLQGLAELTHAESVLMSCADELPFSSGAGDLLWCSDPSSPHCRPAAPPAPKLELWDSPVLTLVASVEPAVATFVWLPWPRPEIELLLTRSAAARLDRPPRV